MRTPITLARKTGSGTLSKAQCTALAMIAAVRRLRNEGSPWVPEYTTPRCQLARSTSAIDANIYTVNARAARSLEAASLVTVTRVEWNGVTIYFHADLSPAGVLMVESHRADAEHVYATLCRLR